MLAACAPTARAQTVQTPEGLVGPSPFGQGARVALNDAGDAVVAWRAGERVLAAIGDAQGFGAPAAFAAPGARGGAPQVAIDQAGNAVVVWETTREYPRQCSKCAGTYEAQSTGVWVVRRRAGASFGEPQTLAGVLDRYTSDDKTARPRLAATLSGRVVVSWADGAGTVASALTGGAFASPRRLAAANFSATSLAVGGDGGLVAGDHRGEVVTCPPEGECVAPRYLAATGRPDAGVGEVQVAANEAGAMLAAYAEAPGIGVAQRPEGGDWTPSRIISAGGDVRVGATALGGDGEATVAWVGNVDPRIDQRRHVFEAHWSDSGPVTTAEVSASNWDANPGPRAALTSAGDVAFALSSFIPNAAVEQRTVAQFAVRGRAAASASTPTSLTPEDEVQAPGDGPDAALNVRGDLLAVWADVRGRTALLKAQWTTTAGSRPPITLASTAVTVTPAPMTPRGHVAMVSGASGVKPTVRGFVPVALFCLSIDGRRCRGTLTLRSKGARVGRARFTISAGRAKRIPVRLARRLRSRLAALPRGLTVVATAATEAPNGAGDGRHAARISLRRRPS
jgi:hypothetical protein